jgi:PhoH-like ATPase
MTKNNYILDTSVLVYDPLCFKTFTDGNVIIPITVLDELDKLKKQPGEAGKNARVCIKLLDELCSSGDIGAGIDIENNINLKIDATHYDPSQFGDALYGDNRILACAHFYNHYGNAILVTNDINLRVRARVLKIGAVSCETKQISFSDLYSGIVDVESEELGTTSRTMRQ